MFFLYEKKEKTNAEQMFRIRFLIINTDGLIC